MASRNGPRPGIGTGSPWKDGKSPGLESQVRTRKRQPALTLDQEKGNDKEQGQTDSHSRPTTGFPCGSYNKAKQKAAKELGVPAKILVPVENIIKVDDREREIAEKEKFITELKERRDQAIADKEKLARENAELKKRLDMK